MMERILTVAQDAQREREWLRWYNYWQPTNAEMTFLLAQALRQAERMAAEAVKGREL